MTQKKKRATKTFKVWENSLIKHIQKCEYTSSTLYIKKHILRE